MATKIPLGGGGDYYVPPKLGYGPDLPALLGLIQGALPLHANDDRETQAKSMRAVQDFILTNSSGDHNDFEQTVTQLMGIAEVQPQLRQMAVETVVALYEKLPEPGELLDDLVRKVMTKYVRDQDIEVRRTATRAAAKLGVAAVEKNNDKAGFAKFLSDVFNAEKDSRVKERVEAAMAAMERADASHIQALSQSLKVYEYKR